MSPCPCGWPSPSPSRCGKEQKKAPPGGIRRGGRRGGWRRRTLPQSLLCSTIRAARLNGRVRDGNGCGPRAMTTSQFVGGPRIAALGVVRSVAARCDVPFGTAHSAAPARPTPASALRSPNLRRALRGGPPGRSELRGGSIRSRIESDRVVRSGDSSGAGCAPAGPAVLRVLLQWRAVVPSPSHLHWDAAGGGRTAVKPHG